MNGPCLDVMYHTHGSAIQHLIWPMHGSSATRLINVGSAMAHRL